MKTVSSCWNSVTDSDMKFMAGWTSKIKSSWAWMPSITVAWGVALWRSAKAWAVICGKGMDDQWCFHFVPTQKWRYTTQVYTTHCTSTIWFFICVVPTAAPPRYSRQSHDLERRIHVRWPRTAMTTWFVEVGSIGKLNLIGLSMTQAVGNVQGIIFTPLGLWVIPQTPTLIFQGQMSNWTPCFSAAGLGSWPKDVSKKILFDLHFHSPTLQFLNCSKE